MSRPDKNEVEPKDPAIASYSHKLEMARRLLRSEGWTEREIDLIPIAGLARVPAAYHSELNAREHSEHCGEDDYYSLEDFRRDLCILSALMERIEDEPEAVDLIPRAADHLVLLLSNVGWWNCPSMLDRF